MKHKKPIKDILYSADDYTAEEIAEMTDAADKETKERIYAMTCKRLAQKKGGTEASSESFRVTVTRRPAWMHTVATTAACLVIAGGLTGGAVMLHHSANSTPSPEFAEQTTQEQTTTAVTEQKIQKAWTEEELYNLLQNYDVNFSEYAVLTGSYERSDQDGFQIDGTYQADFTKDWYYTSEIHSRDMSDGTWSENFQNNQSYFADGYLLRLYDYAPHATENSHFIVEQESYPGIMVISNVQSMLADVMTNTANWKITGTQTMQNVAGNSAYDRECVLVEGKWDYENKLLSSSYIAFWESYTAAIDTETGMCMQFTAFDENNKECFSIHHHDVHFSRESISITPPSRMGELIHEGGFTGDTDLPEIFSTNSSEDVYIVKIVDRAKEEGLPFAEALEKIHEDERNEYFLSGIYSHYVIVHYSDETQEDIKSALKNGRAKISDLDRFRIHYWTEPKKTTEPPTVETTPATTTETGLCSDPLQSTTTTSESSYPVCSHPLQSTTTKPLNPSTNVTIVKIVDRTKEEDLVVADALEKIHEDEKNEYFLGAIYSHYVIVHYSDGTQEDIKSALKNGRAKITDLDRFGIHYYTEPKEVQNPNDPKLHPLYEKYPEYFNLGTFKGLEVYVWQMSESSYYCGVLPGTNRLKTTEEITALMANGATIDEMKEILAVYGIGKENIFIMPLSSYGCKIDVEYCRKIEAMFWEN